MKTTEITTVPAMLCENIAEYVAELEDAMEAFNLLIGSLREHGTGGTYIDAIGSYATYLDRILNDLRQTVDGVQDFRKAQV